MWIFLVLCLILQCCRANEAFRLPIICVNQESPHTVEFTLLLSYVEIEYWYFRVDEILTINNCDPIHFVEVKNHILLELQRFKFIQSNPIELSGLESVERCSVALDLRNNMNNNNEYCRYILYDDIKNTSAMTSYEATNILLQLNILSQNVSFSSSVDENLHYRPMFLSNQNEPSLVSSSNPLIDMNGLFAEYKIEHRPDIIGPYGAEQDALSVAWNRPTDIPYFIRNNGKRRIIIYQSRGVFTGGTVALIDVYKALLRLGYEDHASVLMCTDDNYGSEMCSASAITDNDIVITGEWCGAVLDDFNISTDVHKFGINVLESRYNRNIENQKSYVHYKGRGIQYHLGFHHASNFCRGHVAVSDCHHLHTSLRNKILGNYYVGCPMTDSIKKAFVELMIDKQILHRSSLMSYLNIKKENLILIDTDIWDDYPLESGVSFQIPMGYKVVYLSNIPHQLIPLLLQRAKVIIDLALPGPERISSEGILLGVLPLLSNRWTGISHIDFPVNATINKVNHLDAQLISNKLQYLVDHYESLLVENIENNQFFNYILSMWRRHHNTIDVMIGSSHFHFILLTSGNTVEEEILCNYQILSILFLYPMASIDLYVDDVIWYIRHHYMFYTLLKEAGYIRYDPFDPGDFGAYKEELDSQSQTSGSHSGTVHRSFVQIRTKTSLERELTEDGYMNTTNDTLADTILIPSWEPVAVVLPSGYVFNTPISLLKYSGVLNDVKSNSKPIHVVNIHSNGERWEGQQLSTLLFSPTVSKGIAYQYLMGAIDHSIETQDSHSDDMVSICTLLLGEEKKHEINENKKVEMEIYSITKSLPWSTYHHFIQNNRAIDTSLYC